MKTKSLMESSYEEVIRLPRDNKTYANHWILSDGYEVTIMAQRSGEPATQRISVPRRVFNELVKFYTKQQPLRKAKP